MLSIPLLKRDMIQIFKPMIIFIAVLGMYTGVIVYMYNPEMMTMLTEYQRLFPGMLQAVGMTGVATNLIEFMNMYLYGFLMIIIPMLYIIVIGNSLIMRYVDTGSLACIMSTPNSRKKIIVTQVFSMVAGVTVLMILITVMGVVACSIFFPGELNIKYYLQLNGSMLLVQLVIAGVVFLSACIFNESKNFYAAGAGIPVLFFLIKMLANMGEKLELLKYFTVYTLFPQDMIVSGDSGSAVYNIILALLGAGLFFTGIMIFTRKDFSI